MVCHANYFPALWFPNHNESHYKSKSLQTSNNMPPWDATIRGRTVMESLWCYQMWWEIHICIWVSPVDWSISSPPLNNLKPISSSQMLFKAANIGSNADDISNFKAACFFLSQDFKQICNFTFREKGYYLLLPTPLASGLMSEMG